MMITNTPPPAKRHSRRRVEPPPLPIPPLPDPPKKKFRPAAPRSMRRMFANRIKAERKALEMSQEQFAELCGLHRTYIGAVERAERNVSIDTMERMANALKVPLFALFRER
jgi:ribosome-binding protein aMBF1 (putative translation factor)